MEERAAAAQGRVAKMKTAPPTGNGGAADRDLAAAAKPKKAAQLAEERRYEYVTEPGKGLAANDIEAVRAPSAGHAQHQPDRAYMEALSALYSLDLLGGFAVC